MCSYIGFRCACAKGTAIVLKWEIMGASKHSTPALRLPNVYYENSKFSTRLSWANGVHTVHSASVKKNTRLYAL